MTPGLSYRIEGISKVYAGRQVLQIDRLDIQRGEILALVGPSGAGKSTLLRMLNFLDPPSAGLIRYGDYEFGPNGNAPLATRREVTTVSQRPVLLDRPVQANVEFGLRLRGQRKTSAPVTAALQQVGLAHLARQQARTLSGGEAQRVALARAMVIQPAVLLLDEPTANLDPFNVGLIEQIVRTLNQEQHTTMVLVTHNIFQAHRLANRVGFMLDGRLIEVADVQTFFEAPADPRTTAFVRGDMVY
jgi:tungstate transport system ATP-binding protein